MEVSWCGVDGERVSEGEREVLEDEGGNGLLGGHVVSTSGGETYL